MTRYDIINRFIQVRGFTSFLEIGTHFGEAFRNIRCESKVSVDPDMRTPATFHLTSDEYFRTHDDKFDIIFVDGLHECNQAYRDVQNSLTHLNRNGVIVMHDCHPTTESMQSSVQPAVYGIPWTGDVWKAYVKSRAELPYEMYVLDNDMGCGIIDTSMPRTSDVSSLPHDMGSMTYQDFVSHPEWMNFRTELCVPSQRTVVYAATRNLYHDMAVSAKSLLYHDGADIVYFITEDDTFPEELPDCIRIMNVSGQQYFRQDGPNYKCGWTYMVLMRTALSKLFPDYDRIVHLDVDTFVNGSIDYLHTLDLAGNYYAAVEEKQITTRSHPYFNFGVVVHNLAKLRADEADNTIINTINTVRLTYAEQDAVNSVCKNHILELPPQYNAMHFNKPRVPDDQAVIKHYAAVSYLHRKSSSQYRYYESMPWIDIMKHKQLLQKEGEHIG